MLAGIGTIAGAIAVASTAWIGRNALAQFRAQKLVQREIEIAEQTLTAANRAFDAVKALRGRWFPAHELAATEKNLKELGMNLEGIPDSEKSAYIQRGTFYRRAEFFKPDFDAVFDAVAASKVFFGEKISDALLEFPMARNWILSAADMIPMFQGKQNSAENDGWKSVSEDLYGPWSDDDKDRIVEKISIAKSFLEKELGPKIKPKSA